MLRQGAVAVQSPGSAAAGRIRGRFSSSSPWFRKPLRGAAVHVSVLVPSQGRSRMRENHCSRTSSWRSQPPSGHGQSFHSGKPHPESFQMEMDLGSPRRRSPPPDAGVCPSLSPLSSTSGLKLPRGTWLTVCWQTPHPFQLRAVQFPSRGGEPGGNATEVSRVVLHSLERVGGDAEPGLHAPPGSLVPAPRRLSPHLNLWHPFPNQQDVFIINKRDVVGLSWCLAQPFQSCCEREREATAPELLGAGRAGSGPRPSATATLGVLAVQSSAPAPAAEREG